MSQLTRIIGFVLIGLGVTVYVYLLKYEEEKVSITALIPAFIGAPLLALGMVAMVEALRKHAMHAAMLVALFGAIGAIYKPIKDRKFDVTHLPNLIQGVTFLLCLGLVIAGIISFVQARLARSEKSKD